MKTKVAEAMMYGLPVAGTNEAFTVYDVDIAKMGFCSDDISSYADFIRNVTPDQLMEMSDRSRQYYQHKYSLDTTIEILRKNYCNECPKSYCSYC
jgi:glycosyltransferase involved in cell wall biosynthesis